MSRKSFQNFSGTWAGNLVYSLISLSIEAKSRHNNLQYRIVRDTKGKRKLEYGQIPMRWTQLKLLLFLLADGYGCLLKIVLFVS